ncbi:nicotinate-nucleotide--dimethylbenzimidazole phosphoribosyltransferase [Microbispora cellulosiformans]|uniref:Nicotinate-nucleotide--dimethylbenzimidazole phosphoribosyltransferase n=1 Tax=Microbispora cellulosiformans TaxID=2614688 RepID=A0A5J5K1C0_9ACTN|nr:nicotinate-nucleotide--dimethylbenzimidazole phosphoribosyltransferase [Microbispora cellulosiformans]KAA9376791.1 nicotinate-nucleotide--dimethylbenzimidazole phosphoribosyltransferase [Microbispora cellulosiformans]
MTSLGETLGAVRPVEPGPMAEARAHQDRLTKPSGSLGVLEDVAVRLAGIAGACPPPLPAPAALAIFAADHGVHAQGVSPWPQEVTAQMVANFAAGGAVANAFAAQVGASVTVVDVGVAADLAPADGLLVRKVAYGTADLSQGPAMTRDQATAALTAGVEVARDLVAAGARCLVTGDMGIANTTASAALICAFTGREAAGVTGRGTGVDDATYQHKIEIVRRGLRVNGIAEAEAVPGGPDAALRVLAAVGGLEHAAIAGFVIGAAAARVPVILDGVIAGASALAACALAPDTVGYCLAGHRSAEPGHAVALTHLGLEPLVDLRLRLGEGTGGLLAHPLVSAAVRVMHEVATFDSAGVADKGD